MNEYFIRVISDIHIFPLAIGDVMKHQDRNIGCCVSVCFLELFNWDNPSLKLFMILAATTALFLSLLEVTMKPNPQAGIEQQ